jgi:hypothetical protein
LERWRGDAHRAAHKRHNYPRPGDRLMARIGPDSAGGFEFEASESRDGQRQAQLAAGGVRGEIVQVRQPLLSHVSHLISDQSPDQ